MNAREISEIRSGLRLDDPVLEAATSWLAQELARRFDGEPQLRDFWSDHVGSTTDVTIWVRATTTRPPFALCWEGVVAMKVTEDAPPTASATVFLFSEGDRLGRFDPPGSDYLHMRWNGAGWTAPEWMDDEYGEWESVRQIAGSEGSGSASGLCGRHLAEVTSAAQDPPQGPFSLSWDFGLEPGSDDRGRIVLRILGERVGRLVDAGRSYIEVLRSPGGGWVLNSWQPEKDAPETSTR
jgi:hypothetical protein